MMEPANPRHHPLDSHPEARVRHRAVAPEVEVPVERLDRQPVRDDTRPQGLVVVLALAAADNLAVALGCQHVDAQRQLGALGVALHVERLALGGVAMDHHGPVELGRERGFLVAAQVVAPFDREAFGLEPLDRVVVRNPRIGRRGRAS